MKWMPFVHGFEKLKGCTSSFALETVHKISLQKK